MRDEATQVMRAAVEQISVPWDGAVVLDVACGRYQYVVDHLWGKAHARFGADISLAAVAENRSVTAACADMYALPFRSGSCDIVVSVDTIEHAADPALFLAEVGRVLRPGGSAVLITPNLVGYHAMIAKSIGKFGAELVWRILKGRSLPFDLYYRANTIRRLRSIGKGIEMSVRDVVYIPLVPHFFWPYAPLRKAVLSYHRLITRTGLYWLLPNMVVRLQKSTMASEPTTRAA
ncbi:MAG TPA: class I SAM-dependent methyltransferase [Longimicrobiales bacterium]|nr:class I SAM-dependent methyltransferase [Longimicrobiales bacterium]